MRITNVHHLPLAIVEAVKNDPYPHGQTGDISATSLIAPPQLVALRRQHEADLEEDAADRIWSLLGQSIHTILERAEPSALTEQRLFAHCAGWRISGQADRIVPLDPAYETIHIEDYKTTSVWSVIDGVKPEWADQLHVLQWLAAENNYDVRGLSIVALLRDWSRNKAKDGGNYPQAPVITLTVRPRPLGALHDWITSRVERHQMARACLTGGIPPQPCTPEERWERPAVFAVKTPGRKTAVKLYEDRDLAQAHADDLKGGYVEHRPGEPIRCLHYCPVAAFCPQRQAELAAALDLAA